MILVCISAGARFLYSMLLAWVLIRIGHMLNIAERAGVGLMGGAGLMTTAVILDNDAHGTPFDVWAATLFTIGGALFFSGFVFRKLKHDHNNEAQIAVAKAHLQSRGKL